MILKILSVHDAAVGQFDRPFTARSLAEGERMILAAAREPEQHIGKHASDISLHVCGDFDTETGMVYPCDPQVVVSPAALLSHQRQAESQHQE